MVKSIMAHISTDINCADFIMKVVYGQKSNNLFSIILYDIYASQ